MTADQEPIARNVAEQAAEWLVRRDGGPLPPEDEARFAAWLDEPAHRAAYERLEALWSSFDAPEEEAAPILPLPQVRVLAKSARDAASQRPRRRAIAGTAIAASMALAVLGGLGDWPLRLRADHVTAVGERRVVELDDGSTVTLDSHSAIAVDFSVGKRDVRLLSGAALFQVAPDRARPFSVHAEGGSVTAMGTAFAVREGRRAAEVTVTQHSVRVEGDGRAVVVGEGERACFGEHKLSQPKPASRAATAWARGRLVVADRPLGEVVAEIARYRRGYISVSGDAAALRVSGVYDLDHPLAAIDSIEKSLGLSSYRLGDRLIVLTR